MFEYTLDNKRYHTLNYEYKTKFGKKLYKATLDGGFSCPNIDGKCGKGGCVFCDNGSGYFVNSNVDISEQIRLETERIHKKFPNSEIIAYFQKNTSTYDTVENLRKKYYEALSMPFVEGLAIGTRADCLSDEIVELLAEISKKTYLTIELGMQTSNDETNRFCNRGYDHKTFVEGFNRLKKTGIRTCIHIINGLPFENFETMLETAKEAAKLHPDGMKIQSLHIISGTKLANFYSENKFHILTMEEYIEITCKQLRILPADIVIERITGDADKTKLIAPKWSADKKAVLGSIDEFMSANDWYQGMDIK